MNREIHVRFCEGLRGRLPRATRPPAGEQVVSSSLKIKFLDKVVPRQYYKVMSRKIRQLIKDLEGAGFVNRGGKGGHRNFLHEKGVVVTISGQLGDDAKPYQEKIVRQKIEEVK